MATGALILALPEGREPRVTGLTLSERGRRVARRAGVAAERIQVARSAAEVEACAAALAGGPLLVVRADGWVVAAPLVEPLGIDDPGARRAVDAAGAHAGAVRVDGDAAAPLLAALAEDFAGADAAVAAEAVVVGPRARHPARTPDEVRAAAAWQFELVNKPLDAPIARYFYRPLARPLTRLFLNSPFTPNMISILSIVLSVGGCAIGAAPGYWAHVAGMGLLVFGGIVDCNDGEVARLRLEGSTFGAWLDAMGDDSARLALLLAIGAHTAPRWPDLPLWPITLVALACTLTTMVLIYWYCIFVAHTTNNQEYGKALGVGPAVQGARSLFGKIADLFALAARRDFMDLGVLGLAFANLPEVGYAGIMLGGIIGFGVVLPTHIKLVKLHRRSREAA